MPWVLRSPKWWIGHLLVVALSVSFINLGFWQLRRADDRQLENQVMAARLSADPLPIQDLLTAVGSDVETLHFRLAVARGRFHPEQEVLVRSQVNDGAAGFHLITPLLLESGEAILVNRGWIPLEMDELPSLAEPPAGEVEVEGWLAPSQPSVSGVAPDTTGIINTVDIDYLRSRLPWEILDVYLVAGGDADELPVPVGPPDFTDQGPHLLYAIQWFAFTVVGVVGYVFLLRRAMRSRP